MEKLKRCVAICLTVVLTLGIMCPATTVNAVAASSVQALMTDFQPEIQESTYKTDEVVFTHPGIGMTKDMLDYMRENVRQGNEPWTSAFLQFSQYSKCKTSPSIQVKDSEDYINIPSAGSDWTGGNVIIRQMAMDADTAAAQTIMWFVTGNQTYRNNAMKIIRSWTNVQSIGNIWDEQIRTSLAVYKFCFAAEILRYADGQETGYDWSTGDTTNFLGLLDVLKSKYDRYTHFINQHTFCVMAYMSAAIFRNNGEEYIKAVDRTTVNSELCPDLNCQSTTCGHNRDGPIYRQVRAIDTNASTGETLDPPYIQLVEMGRDIGHSYADIAGMSTLAMITYCQGTKVDPVTGQLSTASKAVNVFNFLDDRILAGANYICKYNLNYDVEYVPCYQANGAIYSDFSEKTVSERGRIDNCIGVVYNYYKYFEGRTDMETNEETKYLAMAYEEIAPEGISADFLGDATLLYTYDKKQEKPETTQFDVIATQDAHIHTGNTTTNYNDATTLCTGKERHTYIEFDLSDISPYSENIQLSLAKTDNNSNQLYIRVAEGEWDETTITAGNNPLVSGNKVASITMSAKQMTADITNIVLGAVKKGKKSITLHLYNTGVKYCNELWSKDGTDDTAYQPKLIVTGPATPTFEAELVQDAYVDTSAPSSNFGKEKLLIAGDGDAAYLQFDTSDLKEKIKAGYEVRKAYLNLQGMYGGNNETYITYVSDNEWTEDSLTANSAPSINKSNPYSVFSPNDAEAATRYNNIDITSLLRAGCQDDLFSIAIWSEADSVELCSSESTVSAPTLVYELQKSDDAYQLYDMNDDGKVTSIDALIALKIAVGEKEATETDMKRGDINNDEVIDIIDVSAILHRASGYR
jgi:hypothetical protein